MNIGLALSGGGIKGAAHIGVLKALEKNNIKVSMLAGTSIGSVVTALYAMGYSSDEMLKLFLYFAKSILKADAKYIFSNIKTTKSILGGGLISGKAIEEAISECAKLKGIKYIKDIKMPISIPTVDIKTKKEYIFTNRKIKNEENSINSKYITNIEIGKAVRASCSYPGVFAPLEYNGYKFVDGGVLNNLPAEELKLLGADKNLAVKFPSKSEENPKYALDILFRSVDIIFDNNDSKKAKNSDYVIDIYLPSTAIFDIKKINYCYEEGYKIAMENIEGIKEKLEI